MTEKLVRVIPASIPMFSTQAANFMKRRRVAAYARVSTDREEQQNSYDAQVSHYTQYIQMNPEWEYVAVYADEGITGTSTKKRDGFNNMIKDALAGKIDLILTKSVSRFARNTVDSLTAVRKLKEHNVEVFFEKENIYTFDSKGELLITIMSSLAQEESRSISQNTTWGKRRSFADGKVSLAYSNFLGYRQGADGNLEIDDKEAIVVRRIYNEYLAGKTPFDIATRLTQDGIPTPMRKEKWHVSAIISILGNEKYKGDAILQKTFITDFLTKKVKKNEGEFPQFYIERNHPAIIPPEVFEMVQEEAQRRKKAGGFTRCYSPIAGRVICGDCGGYYGRKAWHSTDPKYKSYVWHCSKRWHDDCVCQTPIVRQANIEQSFVEAFNSLLSQKNEIAENYRICLDAITDDSAYRKRIVLLDKQCQQVSGDIAGILTVLSKSTGKREEKNKQYDKRIEDYNALQEEKRQLNSKIALCAAKRIKVKNFLAELKKRKCPLVQFDPLVWQATISEMVINADMTVLFKFRDGTELPWTIETGVRQYKNRDNGAESKLTSECTPEEQYETQV